MISPDYLIEQLLPQWEAYTEAINEENRILRRNIEDLNDKLRANWQAKWDAARKEDKEVEKLREEYYQRDLAAYNALPWYEKRFAKKPELESTYHRSLYVEFSPRLYVPDVKERSWQGFLDWLVETKKKEE